MTTESTFQNEMNLIIPRESDEVARMIKTWMRDSKTFAKQVFPHRFYYPFSQKIHDQIFDAMDKSVLARYNPEKYAKYRKINLIAPRGIGKSSIMNIAGTIKAGLLQEAKFIVPISASADMAEEFSESSKLELQTNQTIIKCFGPVESSETRFSKEIWQFSNGTFVMPRGALQQIRGLLVGLGNRPDLFLVDDLAKDGDSEEVMAKKVSWFFSAVYNATLWADPTWRIIVLGSVTHQNSLVSVLAKDPSWYTVHLEICDSNYKSNWPEVITDEMVAQRVEEFRFQGKLDTFYREYRGILTSPDNQGFLQKYFQYYDEMTERLWENSLIESFVIIDPAKTKKLQSNRYAIIGGSVHTKSERIYFRECEVNHLSPDEMVDNALAMCLRLNARVLGVEVTGLNEHVTYPLINEIARRGLGIEVVELHAHGSKVDRGRSLLNFYKRSQVFHNRLTMGPLEEQLLQFPHCAIWDPVDAAGYVHELLDEGERLFGMGAEDDEEVLNREQQELDRLERSEPAMTGWRIA